MNSFLIFAVLTIPGLALAVPSTFTLEGTDSRTQRACQLQIVTTETVNGRFSAVVTTSYQHNADRPEAIRIGTSPDRADVLTGLGVNGRDQIAVFLSEPGTDLTKATSYNFRWWHRNHLDTFRCENLVVTHGNDDGEEDGHDDHDDHDDHDGH